MHIGIVQCNPLVVSTVIRNLDVRSNCFKKFDQILDHTVAYGCIRLYTVAYGCIRWFVCIRLHLMKPVSP